MNYPRTVLLKTSAATDVKRGGDLVNITGLEEFSVKNLIKISQYKYRAEVVKVETIDAAATSPTANTTYIIEISDVMSRTHGYNNGTAPKKYSFPTKSDLTVYGATAALQWEYIYGQLVSQINLDTSNNVVAASLGSGNGMTITDDAGYFPPKQSGGQSSREGKTTIKLALDDNGNGFVDSTDRVITTDATYAFGVGANLLANAPVVSAYFGGNVVAGEIGTPLTTSSEPAVSGQQYSAFCISYIKDVDIPTINLKTRGIEIREQWVFVDNGLGSATTNRVGFLAFERVMLKLLLMELYKGDPKSLIEFFDLPFLAQDDLGAAPGTTGENKFVTPYNAWVYNQIGTQTIVSGVLVDTGYNMDQDLTNTEGSAYTPALTALADQKFVVGQSDITLICKLVMADWTDGYLKVGFRKKEAHQADFNDYADAALVGTDSTGDDFYTHGILAGAATVSTDTGVNGVDGTVSEFRVEVDMAGIVSCYIDNVKYPIYSAGTTPLVFPAATVLIPHLEVTNIGGGDPDSVVSLLAAVADKWKVDN